MRINPVYIHRTVFVIFFYELKTKNKKIFILLYLARTREYIYTVHCSQTLLACPIVSSDNIKAAWKLAREKKRNE